jgi:hypothetical protein
VLASLGLRESAEDSLGIFQQHHVVYEHSPGEGEEPAIRRRHSAGNPTRARRHFVQDPCGCHLNRAQESPSEADCASANKLVPSPAQLICDKNCHFQFWTGSIVILWSARPRIRISPLSFLSSTIAILPPSDKKGCMSGGGRSGFFNIARIPLLKGVLRNKMLDLTA